MASNNGVWLEISGELRSTRGDWVLGGATTTGLASMSHVVTGVRRGGHTKGRSKNVDVQLSSDESSDARGLLGDGVGWRRERDEEIVVEQEISTEGGAGVRVEECIPDLGPMFSMGKKLPHSLPHSPCIRGFLTPFEVGPCGPRPCYFILRSRFRVQTKVPDSPVPMIPQQSHSLSVGRRNRIVSQLVVAIASAGESIRCQPHAQPIRDEDTDAKRKTIDVDLDSYGREDVPNPSKIRKNVKQSMVWDHFERLKGDPNDPRATCKYCGVVYACHSKRNDTGTMKHHLENCKRYPYQKERPNSNDISF
ncbi:zinc finger BED domain-containing protein RICESLEEPER 3-like [Cucumis melo var. makuwa]|uniref:Zinc finger BED domain-containing protein RICESLEEPER 3-like n=1 Tax=Cucumis melo var. makuwa TaxID=1194695 RepID=A0A5A7TL62_CUCMM|nr:zinc finger BED domain-containing protein RICESLEEPER 3-like [Cucumis melo var. makuwa]